MVVQHRLVACRVGKFCFREACAHGGRREVMESMLVDLRSRCEMQGQPVKLQRALFRSKPACMLTFAILERRKLRTMYLYRSSSVCMTISAKLVFGSMSPVISSTFSICALMRSFMRSKMPSAGHLCDQMH